MLKPIVRIQYLNFSPGFNDELFFSHVLMDLCSEYEFVLDGEPDILLVNCYGQHSIGETSALRVGYFSENMPPDLINFDYFFGCEYTHLIANSRYCKRFYGPLTAHTFSGCSNPAAALAGKTEFCNFIYSHRVGYRERFYRHLSTYRSIKAPGKSMNNCSDLAPQTGDWHAAKKAYLRNFKFTIAFENSRRAGYATEKLFDAFEADTVPIYWGDPELDAIVNKSAVVWVDGDCERDVLPWLSFPERREPYRPFTRTPTLLNNLAGRANELASTFRDKFPYSKGFAAAIEEVKFLDSDDDAYCAKLSQPRSKQDAIISIRDDYYSFWRKIIAEALAKRSAKRRVGLS